MANNKLAKTQRPEVLARAPVRIEERFTWAAPQRAAGYEEMCCRSLRTEVGTYEAIETWVWFDLFLRATWIPLVRERLSGRAEHHFAAALGEGGPRRNGVVGGVDDARIFE